MAWVVDEDTSFVVGDSPHVITINADSTLHKYPPVKGYIACDGTGNILIEMARFGTGYEDQFTLKTAEVVEFEGEIGLVRITYSGTDSAYRCVVQTLIN